MMDKFVPFHLYCWPRVSPSSRIEWKEICAMVVEGMEQTLKKKRAMDECMGDCCHTP